MQLGRHPSLAPAVRVQSMLGHAWAQMTLDRYGDLSADELDAVADRLDAARADQVLTRRLPDTPVARIGLANQRLTCTFAVPPAGFEPATHGLGNRCSIP